MKPNQLDLFSQSEVSVTPSNKPPILLMDVAALSKWKARIFTHQQRVKKAQPVKQESLFTLSSEVTLCGSPTHVDPHIIDPFTLKPSPLSFYRLPADSPGQACLYFVIDMTADLLLYVGETCKSNKRWKGTHDCKRYIEKYLDLHYKYELNTAVNIAFWWDAPEKTRPRQELELALIQKWKPPFNKENWQYWGQPFG